MFNRVVPPVIECSVIPTIFPHSKQAILGCGMKNLGRSCFFNACFQALFHIPIVNTRLQVIQNGKCNLSKFSNCVSSTTFIQCKIYLGTCVVAAITKCFKKTHTKETLKQISPTELYNVMKRDNLDLLNGKVQDAQEFWMRIIGSIEELTCCQGMKGLFLHKFTSLVKCEICDRESEIDDETTGHVIKFRGRNTIEEAINDYFSEESVEDYVCPDCFQHSSTKSHWFKSAPDCLVFVLSRFDNGFKKLNDHIELTEKLDLSDKILTDEDVRLNYSLVSTINHYGSIGSNGHYTAISSHSNAIYEFDDANVRSVGAFNGSSAYIVIYELKKVF